MKRIAFTGERLVPGIKGDLVNEHLHRYAFASSHVEGKKVLDIACGEGYGSYLLSIQAESVKGVDISEEIIQHAIEKYKKPNLEFKVGLAERIPYPDQFFDVVVSFETIEHLVSQKEMIEEIFRVLKANGKLIISSPDKGVYSDSRNYKNKFHEKELYADEFIELIRSYFPSVSIFGQSSQASSLIYPLKKVISQIQYWEGDFEHLNNSKFFSAKFILLIASKIVIDQNTEISFFVRDEKDSVKEGELDYDSYKKSFRYKFANLIFLPWDKLKRLRRSLNLNL